MCPSISVWLGRRLDQRFYSVGHRPVSTRLVLSALTTCLTVCVDPTLNTLNQPSKASLNRHGGGTSVKAADWFCCCLAYNGRHVAQEEGGVGWPRSAAVKDTGIQIILLRRPTVTQNSASRKQQRKGKSRGVKGQRKTAEWTRLFPVGLRDHLSERRRSSCSLE
ncbi:unnamed protein product [Boreogadus saida]